MSRLRVQGGRRLAGRVAPPPDKSITHRALILAALAEGRSVIRGLGFGADNRATARVLGALGVCIRAEGAMTQVLGVGGPLGLTPSAAPLDCGNSGTTMRLMAGVLAACPGRHELVGDASLSRRPMARLRPLEAMGARLEGQGARCTPPLAVIGEALVGAEHRLEVASAQVKSALLLAGAFATQGATVVHEPGPSRDHTERALGALGVDVEVDGLRVEVRPVERPWPAFDARVPPDFSSAAFLLAAGALTGGAVEVETGVNPRRTGLLDALEAFGIGIRRVEARPPAFGDEPVAVLAAEAPPIRGAHIRDPVSLRAIDELPLIAAVAACAPGPSTIRDAAELRVKESDRIEATAAVLRAFGVEVETHADGLDVAGGGPTRGAQIDAAGDHRIAMTAAVLGLVAPGETEITGADVIDVSYPGFHEVLRHLGGAVEYES